MKIAWVSSWNRVCGIADYSKVLWPAVQSNFDKVGDEGILVSLDEYQTPRRLLKILNELKPDLIHFQHEYGIWGGKNPPFYFFPKVVENLRKLNRGARLLATAHTVLSSHYRFPVSGKGWEVPFRFLANAFLNKRLNQIWGTQTWGLLDGVIVHSRHQIQDLEESGARRVCMIPHFVPSLGVEGTVQRNRAPLSKKEKVVLVFGFFSKEKGQDIAIQALAHLPKEVTLILAGGVRRKKDRKYLDDCLKLARSLRVSDRVKVTGFVESRFIDKFYEKADLVLAPFRETSGSGSLAQAFARGTPVLTSDLPLNLELTEREEKVVEIFKSEDTRDCARKIHGLLEDENARKNIQMAARKYAISYAPARIAEKHIEFYRSLEKK